jgi:ADP-heptose:LPS heptosyltransferase
MNRHFKKYYFYFAGRLLDLIGRYDHSIAYYSKVIQIRTFFWDVQTRHIAAYQKSSKNCYLEIHGGVGDFLQFLPFVLKNKAAKFIVATHFMNAKAFFESLGVSVSKYYFYNNPDEHRTIRCELKKLPHSYWCPRKVFFDHIPFIAENKPQLKTDIVIGLQIGSSRLTNSPLSVKFALKLIDVLLRMGCSIILFGTKKEIDSLKLKPSKALYFANDKDITQNLSLVHFCDLLIGGESVFKTMSSMSRIQTLVIHEDNNNRFRDRVFTRPYIQEGVMHVYKYKDLEKEIPLAIDFTQNLIRNKLKLIPSNFLH